MTAESGHAASRVYIAQDGSFHENGAGIYDADETAKTATNAELNILHGVTANSAELNVLDGVVRTYTQINNLVQGTGSGVKVAGSAQAVTGSAAIDTGLSTIVSIVATLGVNPTLTSGTVVSVDSISSGSCTIKVWKPTGSADCTPTASAAVATVRWLAIGT